MTDNNPAFADAFNLLCGERIGSGIHRDVFECNLRPEFVVKVEIAQTYRYFANVHEMKFWDDWCLHEPVAKWLAPCEFLSPDGRILLQRRIEPIRTSELPDKLPGFLTDIKPCNFGYHNGRIVCCDYAMTNPNANKRMKKVDWRI